MPGRNGGAALGDRGTRVRSPRDRIIPAAALQTLLGRFGVRVSRMLVDAQTGVTIETGSAAYRPPARLQHYVRARDGTCRFPGSRPGAASSTT
ncbi:MAG: hypothetical protein M3424_04650 [Actinomycetota bacterium]|nr:hypothetical protein [Actinomycetota bacterium]MDQ3527165.1 hypothetical protein [Actinomycetota bacterium]